MSAPSPQPVAESPRSWIKAERRSRTVGPSRRMLTGVWMIGMVALLNAAWPQVVVWLPLLGLWLAIALADLGWSLRTVRNPEVWLPKVVRFTKDRAGEVPVVLTRDEATPSRVRLALGLPQVFQDESEEKGVNLPTEGTRSQMAWVTKPGTRGRYLGVSVGSEVGSKLGCWELRERSEVASELRVYPDLFRERKAMAALFLNQGRFGSKVQRTVGRGREFEKLREYLPGDGFDEIDWKATAKRGAPVTKVFQAERTQEIYVVIDASRLSARAVEIDGIVQTVLERYITAAMVLLLAAERQGDRFGLVVYGNRVTTFLRAGTGRAHYGACREAVHALQPQPETPDAAEIVRFLRTRLRQRALLFFITDLTDPVLAEAFIKQIGPLARQHLVLINQVRPPNVGPVFEGDEIMETKEIFGRLAGHVRWTELNQVGRMLQPQGVTALLLEEDALAGRLVTQYLEVKRRQAL